MARIEIELTSSRPDGTWTWRAVGARQPKGTLSGSLLDPAAKVGDQLRAETHMDIDGMQVTAVLPPKTKRPETDRLPFLGPPPPTPAELEAQRAAQASLGDRPTRAPRGDGDRGRRGPGRPDQSRSGGPGRAPGGQDRPGRAPGGQDRPGRAPGGQDRPGRARGGPGSGGGPEDGHSRPGGHPDSRRAPREGRPERSARPGAAAGPDRRSGGGSERRGAAAGHATPAPAPRAKRLHAGRARRDALLATLAAEQRPVAEQVLRGGIPAVRQAVQEHNTQARAAGQPEVKPGPLVALAEELLPSLRAAEWRDRAEAALADVDEVSLRDLRAVVAGSDAAGRDEESRDLALRLREASERRNSAERETWLDEIRGALGEGRVVRALRISSRPPDPSARFPADLTDQLSRVTGAAMGRDVAPDRWAAVLDAVITSPVRLAVKPDGVPAEPGDALTAAIRLATPRVPGLKGLLPKPVPPHKAQASVTTPPAAAAEAVAPVGGDEAGLGDDRKDAVLVEELGQPVDQP